jgi:bifunctional UDP-N-acetylglucosamine pyrophosphorylase/glucosamine-1-phosphate N-acetyltransferase
VSFDRPAAVVVLAAGEGTRMKSAIPKVLHEIGGRSLVHHAVAAAGALDPEHLVVVVGHGRDEVAAHLADRAPKARCVVQDQQLGTGHAVSVALDELGSLDGTVVVTNGDVPLLSPQTLGDLLAAHAAQGNAVTVLTTELADPTSYGRVLREPDGSVARIVEQQDADADQLSVREVNSGCYAFRAQTLSRALARLRPDNSQGELYLTDVLGIARADGERVGAVLLADTWQVEGVNDRVQLAALQRELNRRICEWWMRAGTTIVDPASTWIDVDVTLEPDTLLEPNTLLRGTTTVRSGARVGPDCQLVDTDVGERALVTRATAYSSWIGPDSSVGPYAYLRPGTRLGRRGKIGTYVETKNADIGEGSKVPHLTYVGDATIGEETNIGAATVFVNYDGVVKHHTTIGRHARTGADNMFVAPVTVGDGAYTAAGSVIVDDVPPGAMAVARGKQRNIEGWVERRRAGTPAAEAAARARDRHEDADAATGDDQEGSGG